MYLKNKSSFIILEVDASAFTPFVKFVSCSRERICYHVASFDHVLEALPQSFCGRCLGILCAGLAKASPRLLLCYGRIEMLTPYLNSHMHLGLAWVWNRVATKFNVWVLADEIA